MRFSHASEPTRSWKSYKTLTCCQCPVMNEIHTTINIKWYGKWLVISALAVVVAILHYRVIPLEKNIIAIYSLIDVIRRHMSWVDQITTRWMNGGKEFRFRQSGARTLGGKSTMIGFKIYRQKLFIASKFQSQRQLWVNGVNGINF